MANVPKMNYRGSSRPLTLSIRRERKRCELQPYNCHLVNPHAVLVAAMRVSKKGDGLPILRQTQRSLEAPIEQRGQCGKHILWV